MGAHLQHAPSNSGNLAFGVSCFNISTIMGGTALPVDWDLVSFNFGLHDTFVPTPPPLLSAGEPLATYMALLETYTGKVLTMGAEGLFVLTTPYMINDVYEVVDIMNQNASDYMAKVGVHTVDLYSVVADHCGPLPYQYCDICEGSTPDRLVDCRTTPHYTDAGYELLASALAEGIRAKLFPELWPQLAGYRSNRGAGTEHRVVDQHACQAEALAAGHRFYSHSPSTRHCKTAYSCELVNGTVWDWMTFAQPLEEEHLI